jgi:hypothetical protein
MGRRRWHNYSPEYYRRLLERRERAIAAALSSLRGLPRDIQERILRQSGLSDMPEEGYWSEPEDEIGRGWRY